MRLKDREREVERGKGKCGSVEGEGEVWRGKGKCGGGRGSVEGGRGVWKGEVRKCGRGKGSVEVWRGNGKGKYRMGRGSVEGGRGRGRHIHLFPLQFSGHCLLLSLVALLAHIASPRPPYPQQELPIPNCRCLAYICPLLSNSTLPPREVL